jgi:hypothetical protein
VEERFVSRVRRSFSVEAKNNRNGSEIISLISVTKGFVSLVSLQSETADFRCEIKWIQSDTKQSEIKRMEIK